MLVETGICGKLGSMARYTKKPGEKIHRIPDSELRRMRKRVAFLIFTGQKAQSEYARKARSKSDACNSVAVRVSRDTASIIKTLARKKGIPMRALVDHAIRQLLIDSVERGKQGSK